jgi:hypothetical protein
MDDRFWIQALLPIGAGRLLGVASHEYDGRRHGNCNVAADIRGACWYSSITLTESSSGGLQFQPLSREERGIAVPPVAYSPDARKRTGYFSTSNIVRPISSSTASGQRHGIGELPVASQSKQATDLARLRRSGFPCRPDQTLTTVRAGCAGCHEPAGPINDLYGAAQRLDGGVHEHGGEARDRRRLLQPIARPLHWDAQRLLMLAPTPWAKPTCGVFYDYPSLIDPKSDSDIFDTAGASFDLYLTRFNFEDCQKDHRKRDLVRFRVQLAH